MYLVKSCLNEIISVGEKAGEKERRILAEIEKTVVDNSIKVYFPSIGARQVFLDTSTNVWQWNNEKLSNIPLYNTIDRIDKKININSDIVGKVDNLGCETFLSVGDYNEDKGLDRIPILLAEYVRQTKKDIVWIVVGSVSNAKLYDVIKKKCELFGIRNILMDKRIPHNELLKLMEVCDYFIMLHRKSIFDLAILEAMQLGKWIVLSDCMANHEFNLKNNIVIHKRDKRITVEDICKRDKKEWQDLNHTVYSDEFGNNAFLCRYSGEIKKALDKCR